MQEEHQYSTNCWHLFQSRVSII